MCVRVCVCVEAEGCLQKDVGAGWPDEKGGHCCATTRPRAAQWSGCFLETVVLQGVHTLPASHALGFFSAAA